MVYILKHPVEFEILGAVSPDFSYYIKFGCVSLQRLKPSKDHGERNPDWP